MVRVCVRHERSHIQVPSFLSCAYIIIVIIIKISLHTCESRGWLLEKTFGDNI